MADDLWYYEKDGQQHGPVSQTELQALIERGEISRDNLAWTPGQKDWVETGTFELLLPSFKTPPPVQRSPPPPPPQPPPLDSKPRQRRGDDTGNETEPERPTKPPWYRRLEPINSFIWRILQKLDEWHGGHPARLWSAVLLALLAPSTIAYYVIIEKSPPAPIQDTVAKAAPTRLHGVRVPAGYAGTVGQIKIDAYPWAELTRLSSTIQSELAVPGSQATPLVLLVAPGSYRVELGESTCQLEVAAEQSRTCTKVVRTVDAASYYREVGW